MIIEIKGVGCHNKGAEMMMLTIKEQLSNDNIIFTVPANSDCPYTCYSKYGFYPKIWFKYKKIDFGKIANLIPKRIRHIYGFIVDKEVDIILDASGFAYSSQWGLFPTQEMAQNTAYWKKKGKKIILLPQAFGPFNDARIKHYMKRIIDNTDLIFARDIESYKTLKEIKDDNKIKLYPDFTNLFKGMLPDYWSGDLEIAIVPNMRMKDKREDLNKYEMLFKEIIEYFQKSGNKPFFLIFGGKEDQILASNINNLLNQAIPVISEENPYYIKGIISKSKGVVGSRFHSLASALSSNVVAIGTGWSHKYQYLFKDYEFEEGLIDMGMDFEEIQKRLDLIINQDSKVINKIAIKNIILFKKSEKMFTLLKKELGL